MIFVTTRGCEISIIPGTHYFPRHFSLTDAQDQVKDKCALPATSLIFPQIIMARIFPVFT